ncbi:MAG: M15 family metallopeptidase [Betaproteobacteria bacterium]|nr:M15 family metallopeptidase [Betaproteobacteria bacterium]
MIASIRCEDIDRHPDFVRLAALADIVVDLRYAGANNFVGHDLYSPLDCAWIRREAGEALARAAACLQAMRPGHRLLVLDALRPQRVQEQLWARVRDTPDALYIARPERGSIHSFGMAVDVTLIDGNGRELDMGTPFDDFSELSHPALEERWLATGALTPSQVQHRLWLRDAMRHAGFRGIRSEWWHFDFGDRQTVREMLPRVL